MANPDGVGSGSAVPPVGPGSGNAVAPIDTTGSDKKGAGPNPASTGKGSAASKGGALPAAPFDRVDTGPLHFDAIQAALTTVNKTAAERDKAFGPYREAVNLELADSITEIRQANYEDAFGKAEEALENLGAEIEKEIVGDSHSGPFIHPRSAKEWMRAERIAAAYFGKQGGTYVRFMAEQLGRVVDGVRAQSEDIAKDPAHWDPSNLDGILYDAAAIVTRRRPDESEAQRGDSQFLRLAYLLIDVTKNPNSDKRIFVDERIFAKLVIHCAEAMGTSSQKDLDKLEGIVGRYNNPEIADWIKEARRLAQ